MFSLACDASSRPKDQLQRSSPCSKGRHLGAGLSCCVSGIKPSGRCLGSQCPGWGWEGKERGSLWWLGKLFWMQQAQAPGELQEVTGLQAQAFQ